jgi:hypothetical protein
MSKEDLDKIHDKLFKKMTIDDLKTKWTVRDLSYKPQIFNNRLKIMQVNEKGRYGIRDEDKYCFESEAIENKIYEYLPMPPVDALSMFKFIPADHGLDKEIYISLALNKLGKNSFTNSIIDIVDIYIADFYVIQDKISFKNKAFPSEDIFRKKILPGKSYIIHTKFLQNAFIESPQKTLTPNPYMDYGNLDLTLFSLRHTFYIAFKYLKFTHGDFVHGTQFNLLLDVVPWDGKTTHIIYKINKGDTHLYYIFPRGYEPLCVFKLHDFALSDISISKTNESINTRLIYSTPLDTMKSDDGQEMEINEYVTHKIKRNFDLQGIDTVSKILVNRDPNNKLDNNKTLYITSDRSSLYHKSNPITYNFKQTFSPEPHGSQTHIKGYPINTYDNYLSNQRLMDIEENSYLSSHKIITGTAEFKRYIQESSLKGKYIIYGEISSDQINDFSDSVGQLVNFYNLYKPSDKDEKIKHDDQDEEDVNKFLSLPLNELVDVIDEKNREKPNIPNFE